MGTTPTPQLAKGIPLVGIARLAAESPRDHARADVEYYRLTTRSILNRESSGRMPFAWTINPYRGCEFGCHYCYARCTHEFMELRDDGDFERKVYAKAGAPELLRAELALARDKGLPIALGTATDPYQSAEKHFQITRRMLKVFAEFQGLNLSLTTKSVLILRDLDLLPAVAASNQFRVHMTITTLDEGLARRLEPKAPAPARRLEAVRQLGRAGLHVGVNVMPILPGLNDAPPALEGLAAGAAEAGARFLYGNVLFLTPSVFRHFMPFLDKEFPRLVKRYRRLYAHSAYLRGEYVEGVRQLLAAIRRRHGLEEDSGRIGPAAFHGQMTLPLDGAPSPSRPARGVALAFPRSAC